LQIKQKFNHYSFLDCTLVAGETQDIKFPAAGTNCVLPEESALKKSDTYYDEPSVLDLPLQIQVEVQQH
jgi:hypothetical protein